MGWFMGIRFKFAFGKSAHHEGVEESLKQHRSISKAWLGTGAMMRNQPHEPKSEQHLEMDQPKGPFRVLELSEPQTWQMASCEVFASRSRQFRWPRIELTLFWAGHERSPDRIHQPAKGSAPNNPTRGLTDVGWTLRRSKEAWVCRVRA